jgi:two-component system alkaline phosphatase synthesis response regulator PhoP
MRAAGSKVARKLNELIYVLESNESENEFACGALSHAGFEVCGFFDSANFFGKLIQERPHLILLEVMLSESEDSIGLTIIKGLKDNPDTKDVPVIFLTSKVGELDKVKGLHLGADDYITKPFSVLELAARVKAVLRRCNIAALPEQKNTPMVTQGLHINTDSRQVTIDDKKIQLTYREYELLLYLFEHMGVAVSRAKLLDEVWGNDFYGIYRTVDVHIRSLRDKLQDNAQCPRFIKTIRGHGYMFLDTADA